MRPLRLPLRAFLFSNPKGDLQNRGETHTRNYKTYAVQAFSESLRGSMRIRVMRIAATAAQNCSRSLLRPLPSSTLLRTRYAMPQLTEKERNTLVSMLKQKKTPQQMLASLQAARTRKGLEGPGKTAIYDFLAGQTHAGDGEETRGRAARLTNAMLKIFDRVRVKLIKDADGDRQVTWDEVVSEGIKAGLACPSPPACPPGSP